MFLAAACSLPRLKKAMRFLSLPSAAASYSSSSSSSIRGGRISLLLRDLPTPNLVRATCRPASTLPSSTRSHRAESPSRGSGGVMRTSWPASVPPLPSYYAAKAPSFLSSSRHYSTSYPALQTSSAASTLLADLLTRERAEEIENDTLAVPPELADLKAKLEQDANWKIVDVGGTTRLTRALPNVPRGKVIVHFHCQDVIEELDDDVEFVDEDEVSDGAAAGAEGDDEEEEEVAGAVRFTVAVAVPSQKTLVFQCVTDYGRVQIRSVTATAVGVDELFQQGGSNHHADLPTGSSVLGDPKDYQGPVFDELAHDLQQAFHQYVAQELGVNEDVAAFVSMHADHREQVCYVKFLDECHGAIKPAS